MVLISRFHASIDEDSSPLALQLRDFVLQLRSPAVEAAALVACAAALLAASEAVEQSALHAAMEQAGVSASDLVRLLRNPDEAVVDAAAPLIAALAGQGKHTTELSLPGHERPLRLVEQPCTSCGGHGYGRKVRPRLGCARPSSALPTRRCPRVPLCRSGGPRGQRAQRARAASTLTSQASGCSRWAAALARLAWRVQWRGRRRWW